MKGNFKRNLIFCLIVSLVFLKNSTIIFASYLNVENPSTLTVDISFKGGKNQPLKWIFDYNDNFFSQSSLIYNHDLAKISLGLALASGSDPELEIYWGETRDNIGRENYIKRAFSTLGFSNDKYYLYDISLNDNSNKTAFAIAQKKMRIDNEDFTLIVIIFRGSGYGAEWGSNLLLGSDIPYHQGFYESSKMAQDLIIDYILDMQKASEIEGDLKLWISGFSRGGSIANLFTADLNKIAESDSDIGNLLKRDNIYTYTFAASKAVMNDGGPKFTEENLALNKNIFNIINPSDMTPEIALSYWNFQRYGIDMVFSYPNLPIESPESISYYNSVASIYRQITGENYLAYEMSSQHLLVKELESLLSKFIPDVHVYTNNYQQVITEIAALVNTRVPNSENPETWDKVDLKTSFIYKYGREGQIAYVRNDIYISIRLMMLNVKFGLLRIPFSDIYSTVVTFFAISDLYNLKFDNVNELIKALPNVIKVYNSLIEVNVPMAHYPETYLSWMFSTEDPDFLFI